MRWETVIGLEIHAQLATSSKIFSGASTAYGAAPNSQACAVDLGLPGVLPVVNDKVVEFAIRLGLALEATIAPSSIFARKNYFYPDLPKGYQISQYEEPIVSNGRLVIDLPDGGKKTIRVLRAHLEEDAGKSVHDVFPASTGIDLNRAGTPLLEIVSEPDLRSPEEAVAYMRAMHTLVRFLGICDGNMQEGSFRCDANVSVRPLGSEVLGTRAEIKNINSFRFVEKAIAYEVERQIDLIESGGTVVQETRLYDAERDETRSMRGKEDAHDYRYFPDPDLLPLIVPRERIDAVRAAMPELPARRRERYVEALGLPDADARKLSEDRETAQYFEALQEEVPDVRLASNWVNGELAAALNRDGLTMASCPVTPAALGLLLRRISDRTVSNSMAKQVFDAMWSGDGTADEIIQTRGLRQMDDAEALGKLVDAVVSANPDQVAQFRAGKEKVFGFFVGQLMKQTKGQADPQRLNTLLRERLSRD